MEMAENGRMELQKSNDRVWSPILAVEVGAKGTDGINGKTLCVLPVVLPLCAPLCARQPDFGASGKG